MLVLGRPRTRSSVTPILSGESELSLNHRRKQLGKISLLDYVIEQRHVTPKEDVFTPPFTTSLLDSERNFFTKIQI